MILYIIGCLFFVIMITIISLILTDRGLKNKVIKFNEKCSIGEKITTDTCFNKIKKYYINLNKSSFRRSNMEKKIKKNNISNIERIDAINAFEKIEKNDNKYFYEDLYQPIDNIYSSKKNIACFLSHLKAIKTSYDNGDEMSIIMEDDINLDNIRKWKYNFQEIINEFPDDLEILNLSSSKENVKSAKIEFLNSEEITASSCVSYFITRKGMERILEKTYKEGKIYLPEKDIKYISDWFLYRNLKSYILIPKLFLLNTQDSVSDINSGMKNYLNDMKFNKINSEMIDYYFT